MADESEVLYFERSHGFARRSLASGEMLERVAFQPRVRTGAFDWSSRQSLVAVVDDSANPENIVVLHAASGDAVASVRLPPGVECWQVAFTPHAEGRLLVGSDDGVIREFQL